MGRPHEDSSVRKQRLRAAGTASRRHAPTSISHLQTVPSRHHSPTASPTNQQPLPRTAGPSQQTAHTDPASPKHLRQSSIDESRVTDPSPSTISSPFLRRHDFVEQAPGDMHVLITLPVTLKDLEIATPAEGQPFTHVRTHQCPHMDNYFYVCTLLSSRSSS
jgi:hypothetical protein